MEFVPLNRTFVPINQVQEITADVIEAWGRHGFGAKTWPELWDAKRVVVLAEANSGKTEEFQHQIEALGEAGRDGFFAAIEAVADSGFLASLPRADRARFEAWKTTLRPAWFLLDSLDEARIRQQSLEKALRALERDLGDAYDRARLIISCRGTDWQGEADLKRLRTYFPIPPAPKVVEDADTALTSVVTAPKAKAEERKANTGDILVVALTTLTRAQRMAFLNARNAPNLDEFEAALVLRGLRPMAERPGDLDLLVSYWKAHGQFGTLYEMTEAAISKRLRERDTRPKQGMLSVDKAREGAERLAAAMTLARKFTIGVPDDGVVSTDSIDPALTLADWNAADRAALLDLGIFAPASFGRIRFHHRSVIEFLTATWLHRLIKAGKLSVAAMMRILVNDPFGVATIAPSLRAAAAWLAADVPQLRDYLIEHEPLVLIAHGDPTRLPIETRATLLLRLAARSAEGAVPDHWLDDHALWMFGDVALGPALREAWAQYGETSFRFQLLRLIELAQIPDCEALLRQCAMDAAAENAVRIAAANAMARIQDVTGLRAVADAMLAAPKVFGPRLAPGLAMACFPVALSVDELLRLVDETEPPREYQVEGFGYAMDGLYAACPTPADRHALLAGLAKLCTTPPLKDFEFFSKRHRRIARLFGGMLRQAILDSDQEGVTDGLVDLLSCTMRIGVENRRGDEFAVYEFLEAREDLRRRVIWRDVDASFHIWPDQQATPGIWLAANRSRAWRLGPHDDAWLTQAAKDRGDQLERRVALSGLWWIWRDADDAQQRLDAVAESFADDAVLSADLVRLRTPHAETDYEAQAKLHQAESEREAQLRQDRKITDLRALRERVVNNPSLISDEALLATWPGPLDLLQVTKWLAKKTGLENHQAATEHALLADVFSPEVEAAYVAGLKALWRGTEPERPVTGKGGGYSIKHVVVLSVAGLNVEAMSKDWMSQLSDENVVRAARHASWSDVGIPEWLPALYEYRPALVGPVLLDEIKREWTRGDNAFTPFLNRGLVGKVKVEPLRSGIWALIVGDESPALQRIDTVRSLVPGLDLTSAENETLLALVQARFSFRRASDDWPWIKAYLGLLFDLAPEVAIDSLHGVLDEQIKELRSTRAEDLLGYLFGPYRGGRVTALLKAKPTSVARLLRTIYRQVRLEDDEESDLIKSTEGRGDAEMARNAVLTSLIEMPGEEPYRLMLTLSAEPELAASGHRFLELAHRMAETAAERPAWTEKQVADFEQDQTGPIRTPDELVDVIRGLLDDLAGEMRTGDASPRSSLETAKDEYAVQDWLTWHLNKVAQARFIAVREKEVAGDVRPDISVTASLTLQELAIEVKHGEKDWTLPALEDALRNQLARDYLGTPSRRRGILLISNHRKARFWWNSDMTEKLGFKETVEHLSAIAATIMSNGSGPIRVSVYGLDVSDPKAGRSTNRKAGVAKVGAKAAEPADPAQGVTARP